MKRILFLLALLISTVSYSQELGNTKQEIIESLKKKPIFYNSPVIKTNKDWGEYVQAHSSNSDVIYNYIFVDSICVCILWDIYEQESLNQIIHYIEKKCKTRYFEILNNSIGSWVEFNNKKRGSIYYILYKKKDHWTLQIS